MFLDQAKHNFQLKLLGSEIATAVATHNKCD